MSEYTKGPWSVEDAGADGLTIYAKDSAGDTVVVCSRRFHPFRKSEMLANFSLLAAAPELLEACKMILEFPNTGPAMDAIRAAIAKATAHQQANRRGV